MKINNALRIITNILFGIQRYRNWKKISISLIKGQKPTTVILRNGLQLEAPEDNSLLEMVHEIFFRNVYNPANLPIETDDIVVDIGANIGVFTLFAAYKTQNTVYAIEAFPHNVELSQLKHEDIQKLLEDIGFVTKLNWDGKSPFGFMAREVDLND